MTPFSVYENAYIAQSELVEACPVVLDSQLVRNSALGYASSSWTYCIDDQYASRDSSGISGTAAEIHSNSRGTSVTYVGSIVRNGDYIYFQNCNSTNYSEKRLEVIEYQISTQTKRYITVTTYPSIFTMFCRGMKICIVEDRKILVYENHESITKDQNIYIVDFEAETVNVIATINVETPGNGEEGPVDIMCIYSMKNTDGDILLFVGGWYYKYTLEWRLSSGVFWYQKNYTQDTEWVFAHAECEVPDYGADDVYTYQPPQFIGKDKIIVFGSNYPHSGYTENTGVISFLYDIATNTISTSQVRSYDGEEILVYFSGVDHDTDLVYLNFYDEFESGCTGYLFSFNPSTGQFTKLYELEDPYAYTFILVFVSKHGTYFYDIDAGKLYDSATLTLQATNPFDTEYWNENVSLVMDDNGPSILYWNKAETKLQRLSVSGTVLAEYSLSIVNTARMQVHHLDDVIMITADNALVPNTIKYYLVT